MLYARNRVLRFAFPGEQISGRHVSALAYHAGNGIECDAAGCQRANVGALLQELRIFSANTQRPLQPREETVVSLDSAIDSELWEESVGAVVQQAAEAL